MKEARFVQLEEQIVTLLTETPLSITQLMKQLQAPEEEVLQVIRHLLDHQKLTQTSTMKLAVK
jgi:predicted transcriptional regulator